MLIDVNRRLHHMVSLNHPMQALEGPCTDAGIPLNVGLMLLLHSIALHICMINGFGPSSGCTALLRHAPACMQFLTTIKA